MTHVVATRSLPLGLGGGALVFALADPPDRVIPSSIEAAAGRRPAFVGLPTHPDQGAARSFR